MEQLMRCKFQIHEVTEHYVGQNSLDGPMVKVRMGAVFETRKDGQEGQCGDGEPDLRQVHPERGVRGDDPQSGGL